MTKLLQCIPNFSVGQDKAIIEGLADIARSIPGCTLLDYSSDASHNRSVFTFVASPEAAIEAAVALAKYAAEKIDMTKHAGEHPRMGAMDVMPFVPVKNMTMDETVEIAKQAGERIASEAGIPVFYTKARQQLLIGKILQQYAKGNSRAWRKKCKKPHGNQILAQPSPIQQQALWPLVHASRLLLLM